jgi:hypothetical protein
MQIRFFEDTSEHERRESRRNEADTNEQCREESIHGVDIEKSHTRKKCDYTVTEMESSICFKCPIFSLALDPVKFFLTVQNFQKAKLALCTHDSSKDNDEKDCAHEEYELEHLTIQRPSGDTRGKNQEDDAEGYFGTGIGHG